GRLLVREAHFAEFGERHSSSTLLESRGEGAGGREGAFDHAAPRRCSAAAGLPPGARPPPLASGEPVSSAPPSPPRPPAAAFLNVVTSALIRLSADEPRRVGAGFAAQVREPGVARVVVACAGMMSEVGAVAGAEEVDEEWGAAEGSDDADRELGRGDDA